MVQQKLENLLLWQVLNISIVCSYVVKGGGTFHHPFVISEVVKMAFSPEQIRQLDRLNKKRAVWDKAGETNIANENVDNMLENFYLDLADKGYNITNRPDRFTMRSDLSPEDEKRLLAIAEYAESQKTLSRGYYNKRLSPSAQKAYDEAVRKGYVEGGDRQKFIDFIDFMENSQAIKEAVDMLGSKVIARVYGYGKEKGLDEREINRLILDNYNDFKNGDKFQMYVFNEIDRATKG